MTARHLAPALALVLALSGTQGLAQHGHRGGGGSRGGGGPRGGGPSRGGAPAVRPSHVRPGPGPGVRPPGNAAQRRHPRAGTGASAYYRPPRYGGGHPSHPYYPRHRYYRPYYPYSSYYPYYGSYYGPYYGPYYGFSGWYGPWVSGSVYVGGPSYSTSTPADDAGGGQVGGEGGPPAVVRGGSGWLRLEVRPEDTSVYVDEEFRGNAREARTLELPPGRHVIELVRPGYAVERREVEIAKDARTDVLVEMRRP